jgi:hypothetical protein
MVVTAVLMWGMFRFFAKAEHKKEPAPTSLTREKKPESENPELLFPEPRLQQHPTLDLQQYREEEDAKLKDYGWADPATGAVRIPIEDAKKKLLKQGLPFRSAAAATDAPKQDGLPANPESKGAAATPANAGRH